MNEKVIEIIYHLYNSLTFTAEIVLPGILEYMYTLCNSYIKVCLRNNCTCTATQNNVHFLPPTDT